MDQQRKREIAADCDRFLRYNKPKTVRQMMQDIAESDLSLMPQDAYGNGGFVAQFETELADLLGKEAAVIMPSGTMAQQIALRIWADRSGIKSVAFHPTCHLEIHEQGAYRELHQLNAVLLGEAHRMFTLDDLKRVDKPLSTLLIELPQREIGGQLPSWEELTAIVCYAKGKGWKIHLDGARLWESAPFYGKSYAEIAGLFDTVYVSFYKILGGLPGAGLLGPPDVIAESRIWLRRHGGNLQQQSPAAISAKLGLDTQVPKIPKFIEKAKELAYAANTVHGVRTVPVDPPTNMFHMYMTGDRERLENASYEVAARTKCLLFGALSPGSSQLEHKLEVVIGEGASNISGKELQSMLAEVIGK